MIIIIIKITKAINFQVCKIKLLISINKCIEYILFINKVITATLKYRQDKRNFTLNTKQ